MNIDIIYGPYRRQIAEWIGKDPGELTEDDVHRYEAAHEGSQP